MKKIKHIIVPTDFSATARNAYHYAKRLAEVLDATVTVVHVNEYILPGAENTTTPISELEINQLTQESMDMFIADEAAADHHVMVGSEVKTLVLRGDVVGNLVTLSKAQDTDLIVIGTTGLQDFISKIMGSTSHDVANQAHCPVILVPRDTPWHRIDKIMYASNYESTNPEMITEVTAFAYAVDATIHFVHIQEAESETKNEGTEVNWEELFPSPKPGHSFEIHSVKGDNVVRELKKYTVDHQIKLMAFVSKHRTFWQNLVHKSVTENIALSTDTPLMVIHFDDEQFSAQKSLKSL